MKRARQLFEQHFEIIVVVTLVAATAFTLFVVADKFAFLNFFYIPVLVASYYLGRTKGMLTGVVVVLLIAFFAILSPPFLEDFMHGSPALSVVLWGSFLIVTAWVVGGLYESKESTIKDLRQAYDGIIEILAKYIDTVDRYTSNHSVRVSNLANDLAVHMRLSETDRETIRVAGLLHDIGKIDVSMDVLHKASALNDAEWEEMKTHATNAGDILQPVGAVLKDLIPIVVNHHEHFDGSGYNSVSGTDIPLGARILAVADAYDSMITDRPYRTGRTPREATAEVARHAGTQFDPHVVEAFMDIAQRMIKSA